MALGQVRSNLQKEIAALRAELIARDEQLMKLRTGPQGARGVTGTKGDHGPCGPQGEIGPAGQPGATIVQWDLDRKRYSVWPVMSDGTTGPELKLRELFEQFLVDVR